MDDLRRHHVTIIGIVAIVAIVAIVLGVFEINTFRSENLVGFAAQSIEGAVAELPVAAMQQEKIYREDSPQVITLSLLGLSDERKGANADKIPLIESEMKNLAGKRKQMLLSLAESNPSEFLKVALPKDIKQEFPSGVQSSIEEETELEGELEVLHSDVMSSSGIGFDEKLSKYYYNLKSNDGNTYSLYFAKDAPSLISGTKIRAHGIKLDSNLVLASGSTSVQTLSLPPAGANTFGQQKTLVILVNFQNNPTQPYTVEYAKNVVFNITNGFDVENSYGQTWLTGDVAGWYTIPINNTVCNPSYTGAYAEQAATAAGYNISNYNRLVYGFPNSACSWWGLGTIGGNPSHAWIQGSFVLRVVGHEMGHNFRLYHSHNYVCYENGVRVTLSNNCTYAEYGDSLDIMGGSSYHFNAFQKERLGWLNYGTSPLIFNVNANGTYTIEPYETPGSVKALKILQSGNLGRYYYIENRQPIGFDKGISYKNATIFHAGTPSNSNSAYLLYMTPSTSGIPLFVGKTYQDLASGISVTPIAADSAGISVAVNFGPTPCYRANPTVSISPTSQWSYPGQTLNYNVMITNNDNSGCALSTFSVTPTLPSNWVQSPASLSTSLASGASSTNSFSVTSDPNAAEGYYTITETAVNTAATSYTASALATYNVRALDVTPPTVTITNSLDGATIPKRGNLRISATASDNTGISRIDLLLDSNLIGSCYSVTSCQVNVQVNKISAGTHTITATAYDNAPTPNIGTASVSVTK